MDTKKALSSFDEMPDAAMVDDKTVAALCGCNVSTVWDRSKSGALPKPRKIGGSTRWNVGELRVVLALGTREQKDDDQGDAKISPAGSISKKKSAPSQIALRDHFAIEAFKSIMNRDSQDPWPFHSGDPTVSPQENANADETYVEVAARAAYLCADALLAVRNGEI
ncbi:hypothetical protein [Caballeronia sp. dw_19]|uniref:helix-turn-helix transcriptional regulator n=1 Tax=Caballeronia sp. dw_19 TaxID=2719791 RepID=UPI0032119A64